MIKKIKDLTEREIKDICNKNYKNCRECPLVISICDSRYCPHIDCMLTPELVRTQEKEIEVLENDDKSEKLKMTSKKMIVDIQYLINEHYSDKEPLNESQQKSKKVFNDYCEQIKKDLDKLTKYEKIVEELEPEETVEDESEEKRIDQIYKELKDLEEGDRKASKNFAKEVEGLDPDSIEYYTKLRQFTEFESYQQRVRQNLREEREKIIEEQLGCPLEVREKALDKGFYDENGNHYTCEHYVPYLKEMHTRGIMSHTEKRFKLRDYKKTWWLKADMSE